MPTRPQIPHMSTYILENIGKVNLARAIAMFASPEGSHDLNPIAINYRMDFRQYWGQFHKEQDLTGFVPGASRSIANPCFETEGGQYAKVAKLGRRGPMENYG